MTFADYSTYFEDLATRLRDVAHTPDAPKFKRFNIEEILAASAQGFDPATPCLLLESFEGHLSDEGDNVQETQDAAFWITQACELEDFAEETAILDRARTIGLKIVARLRHDARQRQGLQYLNFNSIGYEKVGPIFGNCFGYRFTFSFLNPLSLRVDPADWL